MSHRTSPPRRGPAARADHDRATCDAPRFPGRPPAPRGPRGWRIAAALLVVAFVEPAHADPDPFPALRARPLFSPTRRPPPPDVPEPPPPPPALEPPPAPPPPLVLTGVVSGAGGGVALLRRPSSASPVRLLTGATIDGWTLAAIKPRSVVLSRGGRVVEITMSHASRPSDAVAPQSAP